MKSIYKQQRLNDIINTGNPVLVYFSGKNCSVCSVLKPKIEEKIKKNFPKMLMCEVKLDENRELSSSFSVFSVPTIVTFFDTKEFKRYGRNMSVNAFLEDLTRPYKLMCE